MARKIEQTASPQRNFTLTTAERVQAIVTGPPAWARRRKHIEELGAQILAAHREGRARDAKKKLAELVTLVDQHNAYYPIEANLPLDPETSRSMEFGEPWKPLPRPTIESLLAEAEEKERAPASLAWSDSDDALAVSFDGDDSRFTLRLDEEALSCSTTDGECVRVATSNIEEFVATPAFEVVTLDSKTIHFPFRLDAASLEAIVNELSARLRAIRAALSNYRGETIT